MSRCTKSLEKTEFGKEECGSIDGNEGALAGWIGGLEIAKGLDYTKRFGIFLEDVKSCAAWNNQDIKLAQSLAGFLDGDLGFDCGTGGGHDFGFFSGEGDVKCFGLYGVLDWFAKLGWTDQDQTCRGGHCS